MRSRPLAAGRHACVLGWGLGTFFALPPYLLALLIAFVSGAVIVTSAVMELPTEKDGRFLPFVAGGLLYGLVPFAIGLSSKGS